MHIVWGRKDPIAVPAIAQALMDETPGAALSWLDGLGHYPQTEDPDRFAQVVLPFLQAHEPTSVRGTLPGA